MAKCTSILAIILLLIFFSVPQSYAALSSADAATIEETKKLFSRISSHNSVEIPQFRKLSQFVCTRLTG